MVLRTIYHSYKVTYITTLLPDAAGCPAQGETTTLNTMNPEAIQLAIDMAHILILLFAGGVMDAATGGITTRIMGLMLIGLFVISIIFLYIS